MHLFNKGFEMFRAFLYFKTVVIFVGINSAARSRRNIEAIALPSVNPGATDTGQVVKACAV